MKVVRVGIAALAGVLVALAGVAAPSVMAAGPGLPRIYQVQRIDSPKPAGGGVFGRAMASAGDLNGDGKDDLLLPQQANSPNDDGQVFVINGATGSLIDTIVSPDPGNPTNAAGNNKAGFGSFQVSKIGSNRGGPGSFTDLASCPGGNSGALCPTTIGPADGVPEVVVGARGVDARGLKDAGRVYVYDGATRALLKRIDQPAADTTQLALSRPNGTNFGRTALNPAGLTACQGNFGVGACPTGVSRKVEIGDMDATGGGLPDLVIGAALHVEDSTTAQPGSHCARTPNSICASAGRVYIYRGEEIVGSSPQEILDGTDNANSTAGSNGAETFRRLRNPVAQADDPQSSVNADSEQFGNTLTTIGDVGKCTAAIAPGETCARADSSTTPDGVPEVVVGAPGADLPTDNPDRGFANAGVSLLVDGATGSILTTYQHPERQIGATFGSQLGSHEPAIGDVGSSGLPDVYIPAPGQNTTRTAVGRGYVLNGNFKSGSASILLARLDDPTPSKGGTFGGGSAGVGDLVGGVDNPLNELLVGTEGFTTTPNSDVHFFNPATERVLQTIADPDGSTGSGFGGAIVPLGDINGDTFLDFAVGAENFVGTAGAAQGRFYIFRSDNSPVPVSPPSATPPGAPPTPSQYGGPTLVSAPAVRILPNMLRPGGSARQSGGKVVARIRGRLVGTQGRPCGGRVKVEVRFAGNRRVFRFVRMGSSCRYSARVSFPVRRLPRSLRSRRKTLLLRVAARFQGNAKLAPDVSPTTRIKVRR